MKITSEKIEKLEQNQIDEIVEQQSSIISQQIDKASIKLLKKYNLTTENLRDNGYELVIQTNTLHKHYSIKLCKVIDRVEFEIGFKIN